MEQRWLIVLFGFFVLAVASVPAARALAERTRRDASVDPGLEHSVARHLARLDDRLGLGTSPDGTGAWTARLAAALEYRVEDPGSPGAFAPHLMARLADDLRRLGVERDLERAPASPGVMRPPELPGRERAERLRRVLDDLRLLHAKLDLRDGVEERTAHVTPRVAPANDDCASATVVPAGTVSGSTSGATVDGDASCGNSSSSPDVWYRYTATETGPVSFDTFGSSYDTVLSLHSGCPEDGRSVELACNDDAQGTAQSEILLNMTSGVEVWVRVSGFGTATGGFDLTIEPSYGIEGTITRNDTGAPLSGATVRLYNQGGYFVGLTTTAADGTYLFGGLNDGTYYLSTTADGMISELYDDVSCPFYAYCYPSYDGTPITVSGGVTAGIDLALTPGGEISGAVTDASTGDPLDAYVALYSSTGSFLDSLYTGADGVYVFSELPPGKYYVRASDSGYQAELYDDIPCPSGCTVTTGTQVAISGGTIASGTDFALDRLGAIAGTLTEEGTGDPIAGQRVTVYDGSGNYEGQAYTQSGGTYQFSSLQAGSYFVRTATDSHVNEVYNDISCVTGCDPTTGTPVSVALATTTAGIDFSLTVLGRVQGTVTDALTGIPLSSTQVYLFNQYGSYVRSTYTSQTGSYEMVVPSGPHFVGTDSYGNYRNEIWDDLPCSATSGCDRLAGTPIEVAPEMTLSGIDFALDRWGIVEGSVTAADTGDPLYSDVYILDSGGNVVESSYTYGGPFSIDRIPPGTYYAKAVYDYYSIDTYQDELYDGVPCEPSCDLGLGTPFVVALNGKVLGVSFTLTPCLGDTYVNIVGTTYLDTRAEQACETLTAGDGTTVAAGGDLRLQAGRKIILGDGFSVQSGGSFRAEIVPEWSGQ
jgi:hypothetical protein